MQIIIQSNAKKQLKNLDFPVQKRIAKLYAILSILKLLFTYSIYRIEASLINKHDEVLSPSLFNLTNKIFSNFIYSSTFSNILGLLISTA